MKLQDKVAIVTGGGKGIGAAICKAFAKEGARVAVADIDGDSAATIAHSLQQSGATARAVDVDITDKDSTLAMADTVIRDYGRIDFRVDGKGVPYVLEVNPNPDISEDAGLANMARAAGMSYRDLIGYIVKSACARHGIPAEKGNGFVPVAD